MAPTCKQRTDGKPAARPGPSPAEAGRQISTVPGEQSSFCQRDDDDVTGHGLSLFWGFLGTVALHVSRSPWLRNRNPGFEVVVGWPLEGTPMLLHPSPKHVPPERVKKGEGGDGMDRSRPPRCGPGAEARWGVRGGGGDKPASLGTARGSHGNCGTSPGARGARQPGLPGALPATAPPRTREINITAAGLPTSQQKQP